MFDKFFQIPLASKGFFCLSLRTSGIVIGALELPLSGIVFIFKIAALLFHHFKENVFKIYFLSFGLIMELAVAITAILLIIGALKVKIMI